MKHVVLLSASPRKNGNSDILCWGENVWQKGEVKATKALEKAYKTGFKL